MRPTGRCPDAAGRPDDPDQLVEHDPRVLHAVDLVGLVADGVDAERERNTIMQPGSGRTGPQPSVGADPQRFDPGSGHGDEEIEPTRACHGPATTNDAGDVVVARTGRGWGRNNPAPAADTVIQPDLPVGTRPARPMASAAPILRR